MTDRFYPTLKKWVSVEPTLFFLQFSAAITGSLMSSELFRKIKEMYVDDIPAGLSDQDADDIYKRHLITWTIVIRACSTLPTFLTGIWAGAYSQKVGRKPFILIGSASAAVNALGILLTLSNDVDAPLWVLLITSSIAGVTGNVTIATLTGLGHIGDTTTDKSILPVRLVAATAAMSVATMFGGFVEAAMSDLPSAWPCVVSIACAAAGLFCALILLPNAPPVAQAVTPLRVTSTQDGFCSKVADGFMSFLKDTGSVFVAVARKREGNKRGMLIALCATIFLVSAVIDDEDVVIQTYLVGEPFCWDKEKFGLFSGIKSGMKSIGSLFVAYALKKWLKLDDAILITIGISSCIAQAAFFGTVEADWLFYMGGVVGCCRLQVLSGVIAFADTLIEPHEIGKIYTFIALTSGLSYFLAIFGLLPLYDITFKTLPWLIWAVMIVLCLLGIIVVMVTRIFWKREMRREREADKSLSVYTVTSP